MTDFSYLNIKAPEISDGFAMFQHIDFHRIADIPAAPQVAAPTDPVVPTPDAVAVDSEYGTMWGTVGADEFIFDHTFADTWIVVDFDVGKDKIMLDHNLFAGLPLGQLDPSLLGDHPAQGLAFDGTLSYDGVDIAVLVAPSGEPMANFSASDIFVI